MITAINREMPTLKSKYVNGNYNVIIFNDGSKIRYTSGDEFKPEFPESIDLKITNKCPYNCPFCHENSKPDGVEAKLINDDGTFAFEFMNTLKPGTELAIGGGSVMTHSQLKPFLTLLKERGIIASMTVNQQELIDNISVIRGFIKEDLINGLGVSYRAPSTILERFARENSNLVIHVIAGLIDLKDIEYIKNNFKKVLILGYKDFRRGINFHNGYVDSNINTLKNHLDSLFWRMDTTSFDNLALTQLDVKNVVEEETYEEIFMGDDGQFTMYIDLPNNKFAKSSIYDEDKRVDLTDNINDMFTYVKESMNA